MNIGSPPIRHIHLLDTAIGTHNIGDEIISDAARMHLAPILDNVYVSVSSAHDGLGYRSLHSAQQADLVFVLGGNRLSHTIMGSRTVLFISPRHYSALAGKVVLVGVGAATPNDAVAPTQRAFLRKLLSRRFVHSVRDERALRMLRQCGISAVNTSCPTLWEFRETQPATQARSSSTACFSLTYFAKDPIADLRMIEILRERYERLVFWPQMFHDIGYLHELIAPGDIEILTPSLTAYDAMLAELRPDIIGTRLHGAIRGLLFGCRVLVVAIDNRAADISAETGLPSITRDSLAADLGDLAGDLPLPTLDIPASAIEAFLGQFGRFRDNGPPSWRWRAID